MTAVLTVNPGSNSLQAVLVDAESEEVLARATDEAGLDDLLDRDLAAVGHRLVHGGSQVTKPTIVDDDVVKAVEAASSLAPLHVPVTVRLLAKLRERLPNVPHVVCPDTAFHRNLPSVAHTYALPAEWREKFGLRRYGFHGLSYAWAASQVQRPNILAAHLGGGCSACAIQDGRSIDTSMGFTPLDGVPMTKRSGSVDPGLLLWLLDQGLTVDEVRDGLYTRSGLLGLSGGISDDTRELVAAEDDQAAFALAVFAHRVRRELAALATNFDHIDALVFTGEIGWDQPEVREAVCVGLGVLGIHSGLAGNRDDDGPVSPPDADVPVFVVRPREDLQLCRETVRALA
ncbi:acetate/propionate family kinase [Kutzneria sp. NPDC052558]|uniref:acetate/propionate family kinase n=1 Tax=Kutzneria sp. NPDC052558 TaxID=3364121 RepID=UPI0037C9030D